MAGGNSDKDQKTELPTAKRRADAARDGDVLLSRELATAIMMLAGAAWLWFAGGWFAESQIALVREGLMLTNHDLADFNPAKSAGRLGLGILLPLASLFAVALLAAIAGPALTGSFGWRSKAISFKANKLNPLTGLKRMFGLHAVVELTKALAKVTALGSVGYWVVGRELSAIMGLAAVDFYAAASRTGQCLTMAVLLLALALLLIAAIDVPAQLFQRNRRLMMTRQEVKDEMRESDGAPELKAAQRARAHAILSGSARKAVSEASVILTNPTHFAVALRYRPGLDFAPVVVARGRGEVALAIRMLAKEQAVPCLEYPQLTRAIYFTSRAGKAVSEDLYVAVATVLAFVFQIERALSEGISPPWIDVPDGKRFDENGRPMG